MELAGKAELDALYNELEVDAEETEQQAIPEMTWGVGERDSKKFPIFSADSAEVYPPTGVFFRNNTICSETIWDKVRPAKHHPFEMAKHRAFLPLIVNSFGVGVTSGTDPEIFVVDAKGELLPAWTFLPNKQDVETLPYWQARNNSEPVVAFSRAYWDGAQAEFSVQAGTCQDGVCRGIFHQLKQLRAKLPAGASLSIAPVLPISRETLDSAEEQHVALGCSPSLNIYDHKALQVENCRSLPWRFAGGHIHYGLEIGNKIPPHRLDGAVKMLDAIIGVASVSMCPEESHVRRRYYGLAGEYRLPKHGLEYRTLSNFWLRSPQLYYLTFGIARCAMRMGWRGMRKFYDGTDQEVTECINNQDFSLARKLMARNRQIFDSILYSQFNPHEPRDLDYTWSVLNNSLDSFQSQDVAVNWRLDDVDYKYVGANTGQWGAHLKRIAK